MKEVTNIEDISAEELLETIEEMDNQIRTMKEVVLSLDDLISKDFPPQSWVVEKLLPKQGLVALSGPPGSYKSFLSMLLASKVAEGSDFFTFPTDQGAVLFIDRENHFSLIQKRFKSISENSRLPIYWLDLEFNVSDQAQVALVLEVIKTHKIKLVIIDSLIRIHNENENESGGMAKVFAQLKRFQDEGAAVLFLHHENKGGANQTTNLGYKMRGSSDILAAVDSNVSLELKETQIIVRQPKSRHARTIKPFALDVISNETETEISFVFAGDVDEEKAKRESVSEEILAMLSATACKRQDIHQELRPLGFGKNTIDQALKELVLNNQIREYKDSKNKNSVTYFLFPAVENRQQAQGVFPDRETDRETDEVLGSDSLFPPRETLRETGKNSVFPVSPPPFGRETGNAITQPMKTENANALEDNALEGNSRNDSSAAADTTGAKSVISELSNSNEPDFIGDFIKELESKND